MNYEPNKGYTFLDVNEEVKVKPTYKLQMKSLESFAEALGYELDVNCTFILWVNHLGYENTDKNVVSFGTMVKWHNTNFHIGNGRFSHPKTMKEKSYLLGLPLLGMEKAVESKLVKQVHLQLKKGKKHRLREKPTNPEIQVISHMINLVEE